MPDKLPPPEEMVDNLLYNLHKLLLEIRIIDGELKCSGCERVYPIQNKICNFVLRDDEIMEKEMFDRKNTLAARQEMREQRQLENQGDIDDEEEEDEEMMDA